MRILSPTAIWPPSWSLPILRLFENTKNIVDRAMSQHHNVFPHNPSLSRL